MFRPSSRVIATIVAASVSGAVMATMAPAGATPAAPAEIDIFGAMQSTSDQLDQLSQEVVLAQESLVQAESQLPGAQLAANEASAAAASAAAADAAAAEALRQAEEQVRTTKAQIEEKKAKIDGLKGQMNTFARDVYTSGGGQLAEMSVVLGSQNPADFTAGMETINKVSRGKNQAVDDYTAAKEQLDASLVQLEEQESLAEQRRQEAAAALGQAQESQARASAAQANLEVLVDQRSTAVGVIEGQRQEVKAQYDGLQAAQSQIEQMLRDREAERQQRLAEEAQRAIAEQAARQAAETAARQAAEQAAAAAAAAQQEAERQAAEVAARQAQEQAAAQAAAEAQAAAAAAAAAMENAVVSQWQQEAAAAQAASAQAAAEQAAAQQVAAQSALEAAVVSQWQSQAAAAQAEAESAAQAAAAAAEQATANIPSFTADPVSPPVGSGVATGGGWVWPVSGGYNSSSPGPRQHPAYGYWACHKGEDIAAPLGTPIVATHSGSVISAGWNSGGYGNMTIIDHGDGTTSLYAHQDSIIVFSGQSVSAGQVIGYVGSTGDSTGPHLHFEIHVGGVAYLPQGWFGGSYGPVPC